MNELSESKWWAAIQSEDLSLITVLLHENPTILNSANTRGHNALMYSSDNGNIETTEFLLKAGASVNSKDKHNWTPLIYASCNGHVEVSKKLIAFGANINDLFLHQLSIKKTVINFRMHSTIEAHLHELSPENLRIWKKYRLKSVFYYQ